MTKTDTVAIMAAILAASDEVTARDNKNGFRDSWPGIAGKAADLYEYVEQELRARERATSTEISEADLLDPTDLPPRDAVGRAA